MEDNSSLKIGKKAFITVVIGIDGTHFEWFRRFHESFFNENQPADKTPYYLVNKETGAYTPLTLTIEKRISRVLKRGIESIDENYGNENRNNIIDVNNQVNLYKVRLNNCNEHDIEKIQEIADKHGLVILEDAAQALGSKYLDRCAGTWGKAGSISLYPAKVLGCFGDGGIILTDDDQLAHDLFCMRDHGRDPESNQVCMWGINTRLDNLQAAVLLAKFKHYEKTMQRRRELAQRYFDQLSKIAEITLPPAPNDSDERHFDIYQNFEIEAENRDQLREYLREQGIGTLIQWGGRALHQIKELKDKGYKMYYGVGEHGPALPYIYIGVIESKDGINWTRPVLNIFNHPELKTNNIVLDNIRDSAFFFYDAVHCAHSNFPFVFYLKFCYLLIILLCLFLQMQILFSSVQ